jgi:hypothetical protein
MTQKIAGVVDKTAFSLACNYWTLIEGDVWLVRTEPWRDQLTGSIVFISGLSAIFGVKRLCLIVSVYPGSQAGN